MARLRRLAAFVAASCLLAGCGHGSAGGEEHQELQAVATTPILADLVRQVAGDRARVRSLVPLGGDPHSHEPTLRDVRSIVYADVAFSNYLMLEHHALIKTLDTNLRPGVPNISLAEASTKHGAEVIPLVENVNLDTLWLGLRVRGTGIERGATRASQVDMTVDRIDGPGLMSAYLTETFGRPRIFASNHDGFNAADGFAADTMGLPTDAHTHMSWAFSEPGVYRAHLTARLRGREGMPSTLIGSGDVTFVVGADPRSMPEFAGWEVLDHGHADITADLDRLSMEFHADPSANQRREPDAPPPSARALPLDQTVVWVPPKALTEIPPSPSFRFLGRPGTNTFQLPQAVLGAHVHGEIDPHLWMDVRNTKAYVQTIAETLTQVDPAGRATYAANATEYARRLDEIDCHVTATIASIPPHRRQLVTTHDAYAYFARAYGLKVSGFVSSNPSVEPSLAQRRKLSLTIRQLDVPAVFLEPTVVRESSVLVSLARDVGVQVCPIRGDSLDADVPTYLDLMRFNADTLARCLR